MRVYDSSGLLVFEGSAGLAQTAVGTLNVSADPWDPALGPLVLSDGAWSFSYDGLDGSKAVLRNGVYLLVVENADGSTLRRSLQVLGSGGGPVRLLAGPNPVRPLDTQVQILWSPLVRLELRIHALDGSLVRDLGSAAAPPQLWDLRSASGEPVADGVYVVSARLPGERSPQFFKLMVAR